MTDERKPQNSSEKSQDKPPREYLITQYLSPEMNLFDQFPFDILKEEFSDPEKLKANNLPPDLFQNPDAQRGFLCAVFLNPTEWKFSNGSAPKWKQLVAQNFPAGFFDEKENRDRIKRYAGLMRPKLLAFKSIELYLQDRFESSTFHYFNALGYKTTKEYDNRAPSYFFYAKADEEIQRNGKFAGLDVELEEQSLNPGLSSPRDAIGAVEASSKKQPNKTWRILVKSGALE